MSLVCGFCWCFCEGQWSFERFLFSQLVVARMFLKLFYLHLLLQGKGFQSTGSFTLRRLAFFSALRRFCSMQRAISSASVNMFTVLVSLLLPPLFVVTRVTMFSLNIYPKKSCVWHLPTRTNI